MRSSIQSLKGITLLTNILRNRLKVFLSRYVRIYKIVASSNLISRLLISEKRWADPRVRQPFSSRFSNPLFALAMTAKRKRTYTREIGYKGQTERNRCNWGRAGHLFLCLFFFFFLSSHGTRAFHEKLYPRKWQRSRQILHYSAPAKSIYIYIYIYIYRYIYTVLYIYI